MSSPPNGVTTNNGTSKKPPLKINVGKKLTYKSRKRKLAKSKASKTTRLVKNKNDSKVPSILRGSVATRPNLKSQPSSSNSTSTSNSNPISAECNDDDHDDMEELDLSLAMADLPSDVLLAFRSLVQSHSAAHCPLLPIHNTIAEQVHLVLRPMIQHCLWSNKSKNESKSKNKNDRIASANASTLLRAEMEQLCTENKLRILRLHGMESESSVNPEEENVAIMEGKDYTLGLWNAHTYDCENQLLQKEEGQGDLKTEIKEKGNTLAPEIKEEIVKVFISCLDRMTNEYIMESELVNHLEKAETSLSASISSQSMVNYLVSIQVLLPRHTSLISSSISYWFTLPKLNVVSQTILYGRNKMLTTIRRSQYKEMSRKRLEGQCMIPRAQRSENKVGVGKKTRTILDIPAPFYVRDLLSRGIVYLRDLPSGQFVKLV